MEEEKGEKEQVQINFNEIQQIFLQTPLGLLQNLKFLSDPTDDDIFDFTEYIQIECSHESVILAGKYIKLTRELS